MRGSLTPPHPEDSFHLPKGADLSINTCKRTVTNCKSPPAHCLFEGLHLLLEGGRAVQWSREGAAITMLILWREGHQLTIYSRVPFVIKFKLLRNLERAF